MKKCCIDLLYHLENQKYRYIVYIVKNAFSLWGRHFCGLAHTHSIYTLHSCISGNVIRKKIAVLCANWRDIALVDW